MPKGEKANILAITLVNDKLHYTEKEITIGQNQIEIIELKPTTAETIKTLMKSLTFETHIGIFR